jgi:drug/metabolite transporter (DMT)-like permease
MGKDENLSLRESKFKKIMIQRIQTIYLLLAAAAGFGALAVPFASTSSVVQSSSLFNDASFSSGDNIGLLAVFAVAGVLAVASIFLFGNRKTQKTVSWAALAVNIIGGGLAAFLYFQDAGQTASATVALGVGAFLPLAFVVFAFLAINGINKDEAIVKSADRLR